MREPIKVLRGTFGRMSLIRVRRDFVTHAHSEAHVIIWLGGAPGLMTVGGRSACVGPEMAIAINPLEPHSHAFRPAGEPGLFLVFYLDLDWLRAHRPEGAFAFDDPHLPLSGEQRATAARMRLLLEGGEDPGDLSAYEIERFADSLCRPGQAVSAARAFDGRVRDFRIRKAIAMMKHAVGARPFFDDVARSVGMSRPHFFAVFKSQTKLTPNIYLNTLRVEESVRLLQSGEPLTSIAYQVGFTQQSNFSRFFRDHVGVTPTAYRSASQHQQ
ncbi:helix-turn-helix transcriptional regulator [Chelatococcus asaccharovorans]|uniref:helix-turn-helix transcriptional regulator n=1 Tax=Chelatococcus asaccharovorans TaxID=28210 RepID=UPI00224C6CE8|nr:AraC family transcriptional regulator [Chelatococcus asaccharovorans]CAH1666465.1 AraC family transcriptional regulator [Chelatococcus asaccharovorans]CAH1681479.1 AraC family transcriptional regulator [Chelatococcus asaccharovorans]